MAGPTIDEINAAIAILEAAAKAAIENAGAVTQGEPIVVSPGYQSLGAPGVAGIVAGTVDTGAVASTPVN